MLNEMPPQVDDLSVEWRQSAMAPHIGGAKLSGFEPQIIGVGEGFMGQLARVKLVYEGEAENGEPFSGQGTLQIVGTGIK